VRHLVKSMALEKCKLASRKLNNAVVITLLFDWSPLSLHERSALTISSKNIIASGIPYELKCNCPLVIVSFK
jgi:hypothetical protein